MNWSPPGVPGAGSSLDTAVIGGTKPFTVITDVRLVIAALDITNPRVTLRLEPGMGAAISVINSRGLVQIRESIGPQTTALRTIQGGRLDGGLGLLGVGGVGRPLLRGGQDDDLPLVFGVGSIVSGDGELTGAMRNEGLVLATGPGRTITFTPGLRLTQAATGTITANDGGHVEFESIRIDGGRLEFDQDGIYTGMVTIGNGVVSSAEPLNPRSLHLVIGQGTELQVPSIEIRGETDFLLDLEPGVELDEPILMRATPTFVRLGISGPDSPGEFATYSGPVTLERYGQLSGNLIISSTIEAGAQTQLDLGPGHIALSDAGVIRYQKGSSAVVMGTLSGGTYEFLPGFTPEFRTDNIVLRETTLRGGMALPADGAGGTTTIDIDPGVEMSEFTLDLGPNDRDGQAEVIVNAGAVMNGTIRLFGESECDSTFRVVFRTGPVPGAIGAGGRITGTGRIRASTGPFVNGGTIESAQAGDSLCMRGVTVIQSDDGIVRAANGGEVQLGGTDIIGGRVACDRDSVFDMTGNPSMMTGVLFESAFYHRRGTLRLGVGDYSHADIRVLDGASNAAFRMEEGVVFGGRLTFETSADIFASSADNVFEPGSVIKVDDGLVQIRSNNGLQLQGLLQLGPNPGARVQLTRFSGGTTPTFAPSSVVEIDLGTPTSGAHQNRLTVISNPPTVLPGTLRIIVSDASGLVPDQGVLVVNSFTFSGFVPGNFPRLEYVGPLPPNRTPRLIYTDAGIEFALACSADFASPLGTLDVFDVIEFLTRWSAGSDDTDFDGDGSIDQFDLIEFLAAWGAGCPE